MVFEMGDMNETNDKQSRIYFAECFYYFPVCHFSLYISFCEIHEIKQKKFFALGIKHLRLKSTRSPLGLKDFRACKKKKKKKTITKFLLSPPSNGGLTLYGKKLHPQQK